MLYWFVLQIQRLSDLVDELQEKLTMATEGRGNGSFQTPQSQRGTSTTMSSLDTPSKYVTLAEEPHGAEFEVNLENVTLARKLEYYTHS